MTLNFQSFTKKKKKESFDTFLCKWNVKVREYCGKEVNQIVFIIIFTFIFKEGFRFWSKMRRLKVFEVGEILSKAMSEYF